MSESNSKGKYITVNNHKIRYFESGEGEPVLFIHGLGQSMYTFRNNVAEIAEHCHVFTIDLIGHGRSEKPDDVLYTIEDLTASVASFIKALNIGPVSIVGFSTGAMISLRLAEIFPELVKNLILLSPGGITSSFPIKLRSLKRQFFADLAFTFFTKGAIKHLLEDAYYDPYFLTKDIVNRYYRILHDNITRDSVITAFSNWNDAIVYEQIGGVSAPVYIFWGENDNYHPIEQLEFFEDELSDLYVGTFVQCGHMLHEERAKEFNEKLIQILS